MTRVKLSEEDRLVMLGVRVHPYVKRHLAEWGITGRELERVIIKGFKIKKDPVSRSERIADMVDEDLRDGTLP